MSLPSLLGLFSHHRGFRFSLLIAVPTAALALWLIVQPHDRMNTTDEPYDRLTLVYDRFDLSAMALRGMNAELGRQAGAPANPAYLHPDDFTTSINSRRPLAERYFLEYPHAMLILFRAGYWIQPGWRDAGIPPSLPDCCYHNIALHDPENADQFATWRLFVVSARFYACVMFAALLLLIAVLEIGYEPGKGLRGASLLLLLPGALFFTLNRFDVIPALLTAIAFACLGRRRIMAAAIFLGLATLVKVYPVLLAPIIIRYLWPRRRDALGFAIVYAATGLLAFTPLLAGADWPAVWGPFKFQLTREPEPALTIYGILVPNELAPGPVGGLFRMICLATIMAMALSMPILNMSSLLRRCAAVLLVFVSLAIFYSPQWILWFAPLLLPLVRQQRGIGWSVLALDLVTYLSFPVWWFVAPHLLRDCFSDVDAGLASGFIGNLLRLARFGLCGLLLWQLLRTEFPWRRWFERLRRLTPSRAAPVVRRT